MDQIWTNRGAPGHRQRGVSYHFIPATLVLLEMFMLLFPGPTIGSEEIFLASLLIGEEIGEELKASGLVTAWSEARPGEPGYADEDGVPVYREPGPQRHTYVVLELRPQRSSRARRNAQQKSGRARADSRAAGRALLLSSDAYLQLAGRVAVWREQVVRVMEADAQEAKAEANARQKERVAAILAGTDAAGAGAGVEEALNCWEEGAYEAETLEALAEFGD
ncbi:hypothetical protein EMIHUDRAFT_211920 [Emiliania huxleyi CCMP1516]|uniref:Uncharacterized protein n=2 Tax=Emiliania huxleyi TaxID=2903 RepID=A0A0D3IT66_EMIH1|nr:hypothetical protein EMIHUDRAFT_211920 [Emiliania huxleyi CCMP1516]EOD14451.1 hypothetical protein EMIHUDRAFT_211920 [Emiliania huxleyi CCMP1516]|eukprot:XP_005766880.1 hypothetical protein EMIHUDRAFT_211920 [Emiliania huxleyi CCMP1516]